MSRYLFRIKYRDPDTGETVTEEIYFTDTKDLTARQYAEDYAYSRAGKGPYWVEEV